MYKGVRNYVSIFFSLTIESAILTYSVVCRLKTVHINLANCFMGIKWVIKVYIYNIDRE